MTLYFTNPYIRTRRMHPASLERSVTEMPNEVVFPVDVKAEEEAYVISAILPGITAEELNIQVVNDTVNLQGEFKNEREENADYLLSERPAGKFYRSLTLPDALDAGKAEATLSNGILTLRVPKAEEARPKSIKIVSK